MFYSAVPEITPEMLHENGFPIVQASTIPSMPEADREIQLKDKKSLFIDGLNQDRENIREGEEGELILPNMLYREAVAYAGTLGVNYGIKKFEDSDPVTNYVKAVEALHLSLKQAKPKELLFEIDYRVINEIDTYNENEKQTKEKKFLNADIGSLDLEDSDYEYIHNLFDNQNGSSRKKTNQEKEIEKKFGNPRMEQIAVRLSKENLVDMDRVPEGKSDLILENIDKFNLPKNEVLGILTSWTLTKVEMMEKFGLTSESKIDGLFISAKKITGAKTNTQLLLMLLKDGLI